MSRESFIQGLEDGYQLGQNLERLKVPLHKKLRYFLQQKSLEDYTEALRIGIEEGKKQVAREVLYQQRMQEFKEEKPSKEKEVRVKGSKDKDKPKGKSDTKNKGDDRAIDR